MNAASASATPGAWLFSRRVDLAAFGGSFLLSFIALGVGLALGVDDATPAWAWIPAIILCDVAHVWATAFRTYLDPEERERRRALFVAVPIVGFAAASVLFAIGESTFWRCLAYVAIFHFVRQQYGWVMLYRARGGEQGRLGRLVDGAAIYASTLYPLLYWHTHLPRRFSWFIPGDIVALPRGIMPVAAALYVAALTAYAIRSATAYARRRGNPGKDLVVVTTAIAWYIGIVALDSDYAFTVTNVFMHGIPYFVIVRAHAKKAASRRPASAPASWPEQLTKSAVGFVAALWLVAFFEELIWDRAVWHDREWLFGAGWELGAAKLVVVPLLALPQLTHYVLDGFIWRRRSSPTLAALVRERAR